jgi:DNA-directed RNA polymerase sigma subunit (sigma70/sigma32)
VQLRELSGRPRLPAGTERRLVQAAKSGDCWAREELVEAFLPLIAGVARVYRGSPTITRVELIQEGVVGLLRALERYDPTSAGRLPRRQHARDPPRLPAPRAPTPPRPQPGA